MWAIRVVDCWWANPDGVVAPPMIPVEEFTARDAKVGQMDANDAAHRFA